MRGITRAEIKIKRKSKGAQTVETLKRPGRGGVRPGAGRPKGRKSRKPIELTGAVDPIRVLESIAADAGAPASARVAAAKALMQRQAARKPAAAATKNQPAAKIVWLKRAEQ